MSRFQVKMSCLQIYINRLIMAEITVREALLQAMQEEMQRDKNVFVMGEEVAESPCPVESHAMFSYQCSCCARVLQHSVAKIMTVCRVEERVGS